MSDVILKERSYKQVMEQKVEPWLLRRRTELWLEREEGCSIYCRCFEANRAKGIILISHGFTETSEKYNELIYYFLRAGYHVYIPEHCGHGHSYRLVDDLSLVHVDAYERYVDDFIFVAKKAKAKNPGMRMYLFGHSMGGGIAAAVAAKEPKLFSKVVLSSPMIRPLSKKIPWHDARTIAAAFCKAGHAENYIAGAHAYRGPKPFEKGSATSRARHEYYQEKREKEPLFQMSAGSYGWLYEAARLNRDLQKHAVHQIESPLLLFQAEEDHLVSAKEQVRFVMRLRRYGNLHAHLVRVPFTRHAIWNSKSYILRGYLGMIFRFFEK